MGILMDIILGALAGWIASMIMKSKSSLLWNIIVGIVGGVLGGWIAGLLGIGAVGFGSFLISVVGACILIFLLRLIRGK